MPVERTQYVGDIYRAIGYNDFRASPQDLSLPGGSFMLSFVPSSRHFALAWYNVDAPLDVAEGTLEVRSSGVVLWKVDIKGFFPPTPAGEYRSGTMTTKYSGVDVVLSARLTSDVPPTLPRELELAARSTGSSFSFPSPLPPSSRRSAHACASIQSQLPPRSPPMSASSSPVLLVDFTPTKPSSVKHHRTSKRFFQANSKRENRATRMLSRRRRSSR
jgi:hypothetical protein